MVHVLVMIFYPQMTRINLDEKSISELIDTYFGNGTYEEVVKEFLDIYNTKISSLIKKNDISIEELCEFLDHYAEAITGKKGQTFESLFKITLIPSVAGLIGKPSTPPRT